MLDQSWSSLLNRVRAFEKRPSCRAIKGLDTERYMYMYKVFSEPVTLWKQYPGADYFDLMNKGQRGYPANGCAQEEARQ